MRQWMPWILTASLLATLLPLSAGPASACAAPPCGYIFPQITLEPEGGSVVRDLQKGEDLVVPIKLTFSFDATGEGYSQPLPNEELRISFEYPRKPAWAEMAVEPKDVIIPITPANLQPDVSDPQNPKAKYYFETQITLTMAIVDGATPVVKDGFETARLLLYAKSNEVGLYKAAYSIKEFKVRPEGAVPESSLAPADGGRRVDAVVPTPVAEMERQSGPVVFTFKPGERNVEPWKSTPFTLSATVNGASAPLTLAYTLVDPTGAVAYSSGPRAASEGTLSGSLTFPTVGTHWLLSYAEAAPGEVTPSPAFAAFPITLEPSENIDLVRYGTKYRANYEEFVTEVNGYLNQSGPAPDVREQYLKWIPFRVEEGATSAQVDVTLDTRGLPTAPGTGAANLYVQLLDPTGKELGQQSVAGIPGNTKKTVRASALPGAGVYHVRISGTGASLSTLAGAAYSVALQVNYDDKPEAPVNASDGTLLFGDATYLVPAPERGFLPWSPVDLAVTALGADGNALNLAGATVVYGILNATGAEVYTSTPRDVSALSTTFHHAGPQFVAVYLAGKTAGGLPLQGTPLLFPVTVGDVSGESYVYPATYEVEYSETIPAGATAAKPFEKWVPLRVLPIPLGEDGVGGMTSSVSFSRPQGVSLRVVDENGNEVGDLTGTAIATKPGMYWAIFSGYWTTGTTYGLAFDIEYGSPPTEPNPFAPVQEPVPAVETPGLGLLAVLALVGAAAVALARRRS